MKKKIYILLITLIAVVILLASFVMFLKWRAKNIIINTNDIQIPTKEQKLEYTKYSCAQNKGNWLPKYSECENINKESCDKIGGEFEPCASACRHDPTAQACIEICVSVCKITTN